MGKIINWVFGSLFRTLGRIICYILIGFLLSFLFTKADLKFFRFLSLNVKASTIDYSYNKFRIEEMSSSGETVWSSWQDFDTTITSNVVERTISAIGVRFGKNTNFKTNTIYRVNVDINLPPNTDINQVEIRGTNCYGSTSTSSWSTQSSYIGICNLVNKIKLNSTNRYRFIYDISFVFDVKGFQISILTSGFSVSNARVYSTSSIIEDTALQDGLNNLGDNIVNNQNSNTENIINNVINSTNNVINTLNDSLSNKCENLLKISDGTYSSNGITANVKDGIITLNGTATGTSFVVIDIDDIAINGNYILKLNNNSSVGSNPPNPFSAFRIYKNNNSSDYIESYLYPNYSSTNFSGNYNLTTLNIRTSDRFTYNNFVLKPSISLKDITFCPYGSNVSKLDDVTSSIGNLTDTIISDNVDNATNSINNFFSGFTTNTYGLSSIITSPLLGIQSLTSKTCSPLSIPLPYVNKNLSLPCMRNIYVEFFGDFIILYDVITLGIVSYWVVVRFFTLIKDFKNPDHDEIEVMDL